MVSQNKLIFILDEYQELCNISINILREYLHERYNRDYKDLKTLDIVKIQFHKNTSTVELIYTNKGIPAEKTLPIGYFMQQDIESVKDLIRVDVKNELEEKKIKDHEEYLKLQHEKEIYEMNRLKELARKYPNIINELRDKSV